VYKNAIPAEFFARQVKPFEGDGMSAINRGIENEAKGAGIKLERELALERERYLRLAADFDNYRKRTARELERRAVSQKENLVRELLPALDNMERALSAAPGENLRHGVEMIHGQLIESLKRHGFEPRDDLGQPFDGRYHDGIAVGCKPELPDSCVIQVWERGWMRGGDLFRPAKVLVNKLEADTV
jgi:molecular chaperone GrpE